MTRRTALWPILSLSSLCACVEIDLGDRGSERPDDTGGASPTDTGGASPVDPDDTSSPSGASPETGSPGSADGCEGVGGSGTQSDPYTVTCCDELPEIADDLAAHWRLTRDIDCSATSPSSADFSGSAWDPAGFQPISGEFTGELDGDGHAISGLTIDVSGPAGLFEHLFRTASVHDLDLVDVDVTGTDQVGALAAYVSTNENQVYTTIRDVTVAGRVTGLSTVGGLVGESYNGGGLYDCAASVEVTGGYATGGLIGYSWDGIDNNVIRCSVSGTVTGDDETGGLIGYDKSNFVEDSWSDAAVTGGGAVGGLIGYSTEGGWLNRSYFAGSVSGSSSVGGLIGSMNPYGSEYQLVQLSFSVGTVSSTGDMPHGLIGAMSCGYSSSLLRLSWVSGLGATSCDPCGDTACSAVSSKSAFHDTWQSPLPYWDFMTTWESDDALPTLR